jgi:hypothetical protein
VKFIYLLPGDIAYRYGTRVVKLGVGDSLLFDASALDGIEDIGTQPVTYLSVVFSFRRWTAREPAPKPPVQWA